MTSIESQRPDWLPKKMIDVMVQFRETKHKSLPNVPTIFEVLKSEKERQAINFLIASEEIGRPIIAPPGMAPERVAVLRKAFDNMMKDPEFLAAAEKLKMDMDPISGEKAAAIAASIQNTPRDAVEFARKLME
jgi:tripartite-type tricarboxylate transporter receptor subunit TctC